MASGLAMTFYLSGRSYCEDVKKSFGANKEVNFEDIIFDSIIILNKEKARDLSEILDGMLKGEYKEVSSNEKIMNSKKRK